VAWRGSRYLPDERLSQQAIDHVGAPDAKHNDVGAFLPRCFGDCFSKRFRDHASANPQSVGEACVRVSL